MTHGASVTHPAVSSPVNAPSCGRGNRQSPPPPYPSFQSQSSPTTGLSPCSPVLDRVRVALAASTTASSNRRRTSSAGEIYRPDRRRAHFTKCDSSAAGPTPEPVQRTPSDTLILRTDGKLADYTNLKKVQFGAMGKVWKALDKHTQKQVLIKQIIGGKYDVEAALSMKIDHPHLVSVIKTFVKKDSLWFVREFVEGQDLFDMISAVHWDDKPNTLGSAFEPFMEQVTHSISEKILSALCYLHGNHIAHCDVKPENIVVNARDGFDRRGRPLIDLKIIDYGLAHIGTGPYVERRGTAPYVAPELLFEDNLSIDPFLTDIYSFGVVVFITAVGRHPLGGRAGTANSSADIARYLRPFQIEDVPEDLGFSYKFNQFVTSALEYEPENRSTAKTLLNHPWLTQQWNFPPVPDDFDSEPEDEEKENVN